MPTPSKEYADEVLIRRLAHGDTIAEAARIAKVSERTVYRRLTNSAFRQRLGATQAAALSSSYGMLTTGLNDACRRLTNLVWDPNPHVGFKASKAVVDLTLKMREQVDIEDRVTVLERVAFDKDKCGVDPDAEDEEPGDDLEPGSPDGGRPGGPGPIGPTPGVLVPTPPVSSCQPSSGPSATSPGGPGVSDSFPPAGPRAAGELVSMTDTSSDRPDVSPPVAPADQEAEKRPVDCQNLTNTDTGTRTAAVRPSPGPGHSPPRHRLPETETSEWRPAYHQRSSARRPDPLWLRAWKSARGLPNTDKHCQRSSRSSAGRMTSR